MSEKYNLNSSSLLLLHDWHVYLKNAKGEYIDCNQQMINDNHFNSRDDLIGKLDFDLPNIEPSSADRFRKHDKEVIDNLKTMQFFEAAILNSKKVTFLSIKSPLLDKRNRVMGILGMSRKIILFPKDALNSNEQPKLSVRQQECLHLLAKGMTMKQIAKTLDLSPRTIEHYLQILKNKLGCSNRYELIEKYFSYHPSINKTITVKATA